MSDRVLCRKGDPCVFVVTVTEGIPAKYTQAKFQARDDFNDSGAALLSVDELDGIVIDHVDGTATVTIGATQTQTLTPYNNRPQEVPAMLRLYNPLDAEDRISYEIPFVILPDVIDDD
jgi:hypothetical protein